MPGKHNTQSSSGVTRVAIYARRSSELQNDVSTERQIRECRERAAELGWEIVEECIFVDEAKSGETVAGRDGLDMMLRIAQQDDPPFSGIIAADTSRFGRHLSDTLHMQELLEYHGVFLYFVDDDLDSREKGFRRRSIDNASVTRIMSAPSQRRSTTASGIGLGMVGFRTGASMDTTTFRLRTLTKRVPTVTRRWTTSIWCPIPFKPQWWCASLRCTLGAWDTAALQER
jgi:hypothetical protein